MFFSDPNEGGNAFNWPQYDNNEMNYIVLDKTLSAAQGLRHRECMFWQKTIKLLGKAKGEKTHPCYHTHNMNVKCPQLHSFAFVWGPPCLCGPESNNRKNQLLYGICVPPRRLLLDAEGYDPESHDSEIVY